MLSEDKSRITKIDNSVYINFDYEYKTKPNVNNTVRGIVLGKSGVGKTSFINSICGTSYLAGVSQ